MEDLDPLLQPIRACQQCTDLPLGPAPIVPFSAQSRILSWFEDRIIPRLKARVQAVLKAREQGLKGA